MAKKYEHIQEHAKEITELLSQGMTQREVGEKLGFSREQIKGFVKRQHRKERKLSAGVVVRKKGRPAKNTVVNGTDTLAELRYKLARKEAKIRELEMENELLRDFLSLTEGK